MAPLPDRLIVMGPSGAGKSAVGAALALKVGGEFVDADDLHPARNLRKMSRGVPLTDDDRGSWLDRVAQETSRRPGPVVVACSALARRYRDRLRGGIGEFSGAGGLAFVELRVDPAELERRMRQREHFMPPALLASQLATLQPLGPDERGVSVLNLGPMERVVDQIIAAFGALDAPDAPGS